MQPRTYVIALAASAFALFIAVAAANLLLDPLAVFGTRLVPASDDMNTRYYRFTQYEMAADRYDGLIFGSSRVAALPPEELSRRMGDVNFASFSVDLGQLTDHLPVLRYVLAQKQSRGLRLRAVFLLLDLDSFGGRPLTNSSLHFLLPPALTGESDGRFWWRNLTAIQKEAWRAALQRAWRRAAGAPAPQEPPALAPAVMQTVTANPAPASAPSLTRVTERLDFDHQLALLADFVSLCRQNGVQLIVATPPISRTEVADFDPADLDRAGAMISRVVPLWNFTDTVGLPDDPAIWRDRGHFQPAIGQLMLDRIFGRELPPRWSKFGWLEGLAPNTP
jgi:hypothetical protein